MKKIIVIILLLVTYACNKKKAVTHIPIQRYIPNSTDILIDVRTPDEYQTGYLAHAINIDFKEENFLQNFEQYDRKRPLYIYCHSGRRSRKASELLEKMGFEKIINLEGGIISLKTKLKD